LLYSAVLNVLGPHNRVGLIKLQLPAEILGQKNSLSNSNLTRTTKKSPYTIYTIPAKKEGIFFFTGTFCLKGTYERESTY
jgi:hypothetical protein